MYFIYTLTALCKWIWETNNITKYHLLESDLVKSFAQILFIYQGNWFLLLQQTLGPLTLAWVSLATLSYYGRKHTLLWFKVYCISSFGNPMRKHLSLSNRRPVLLPQYCLIPKRKGGLVSQSLKPINRQHSCSAVTLLQFEVVLVRGYFQARPSIKKIIVCYRLHSYSA